MKISVMGKGTLAAAVAECCAIHFDVKREPERDADVLWLCEDTPIQPDGMPDVDAIVREAIPAIALVSPLTVVVLSSQVPIGTTARLEGLFPQHRFACVPENIRVASAVADFKQQTRIVVGTRERIPLIGDMLAPFTPLVIWTTPETAELVKHTLNTYLGLTIAFINEIARVGERFGCDMGAVAQAIRTERRFSPHMPVMAGKPFDGGHLERDIRVLNSIASDGGISLPIIRRILESNGQK